MVSEINGRLMRAIYDSCVNRPFLYKPIKSSMLINYRQQAHQCVCNGLNIVLEKWPHPPHSSYWGAYIPPGDKGHFNQRVTN